MFSRSKKLFRDTRGFTLLEVMVAITILLLVILPLASLYVKSLTVIQNAGLYSQAIHLSQERMEICIALEYDSLEYYNQIFTPGFPYVGPLPITHEFDYYGNGLDAPGSVAYDNRDNPDTPELEWYFDPTDSNDDDYPVPVYRDYYNNFTGRLLDPNYNGLCDDDLDGDGEAGILGFGGPDLDDIEIATNGRLIQYSDPIYSGTPAAALGNTWVPGDGLFDTVVEGNYIASMDPMYRQIRTTESQSPILDVSLLLDQAHRGAVSDYRHREVTYQNFVRMTTFIDPTPRLSNPNDVDTWVDQLYKRDMAVNDGYTPQELRRLELCLERDLPLNSGMTNFDVGVRDAGIIERNEFNVNYAVPVYGMKIIVTVFYLTGEGEIQLTDIDNDGQLEEVPMETYGGARRIRLERTFYNTDLLNGFVKQYPPPRRFYNYTPNGTTDYSGSAADNHPVRTLTVPYVETDGGTDEDPCSIHNRGLPYLTD